MMTYTHSFKGIECTAEEYDWMCVRDPMGNYTSDKVEERLAELRVKGEAGPLGDEGPVGPIGEQAKKDKISPEFQIHSVEATLAERGSRYGDFTDHAHICQRLKDVMMETTKGNRGWFNLSAVQKQALEVIQDKIARILSGDPNYADNWHDIQGYAKLVEDRLPKEGTSK